MARHLRGVTQAELADRTGLSVQYISKIESEERTPSDEALAALSFGLGFNLTFFRRPIREVIAEEACHLRSKRSTAKRVKREVRYRAVLLLELVQHVEDAIRLPAVDIPTVSTADGPAGVESAAERLRVAWSIPSDAPLGNLTRLIESKGAVVSSIHGTSKKVSAFSTRSSRPLIIRSTAIESASRTRFDLAHECGHLVIHRGIETGDRETEGQADRFAGAFLFPRIAVRREYAHRGFVDWDLVFQLKRRWGLSASAIIRRLWDTGCISYGHYRRANIRIRSKGWHKGEPHEPEMEQPELLKRALGMLESRTPGAIASLAAQIGCTLADLAIVLPTGTVSLGEEREGPPLRLHPRD